MMENLKEKRYEDFEMLPNETASTADINSTS